MKHYDAIIFGAGLAGLQCERLLGRRRLTVLLVDRKSVNRCSYSHALSVARHIAALREAFKDWNKKSWWKRGSAD